MSTLKNLKKSIKKEWKEFVKNTDYEIPEIFFMRHNNKWYFTISDDKTVYYFVSFVKASKKLTGKVYVCVQSKCEVIDYDGVDIYSIKEFSALQVISCQKPSGDLETFAIDNFEDHYNTLVEKEK